MTGELKKQVSNLGSLISNPPLPPGHNLEGLSGEGEATFQKLVLAFSTVFIGTETSTFSADVQRMRTGLGRAHCRDSLLRKQTSPALKLLDIYVSSVL